MNLPKKPSLPQRSTGGPLPVLLDFRNGGRGWRVSLGALVQATLLGLVLVLPLLVTDTMNAPPDLDRILPPIWQGKPHGSPNVNTTGGKGTKRRTIKTDTASVQLVFRHPTSHGLQGPAVNPTDGDGTGDGPARVGHLDGPDKGVPPWNNLVTPPRTHVPPPARDPLRVGGKVQPPRLIHRIEPVYPPLAKRAGIQGEVVMEALLGEDGRVREITIKSGHPWLAAAAREAVAQWVYEPTLLNGEPYPVVLGVKVRFYLNR
jgi:protein TonB